MNESALRDIASRDDIEGVVTEFYGRAFADPLLGPIFVDIAKLDLVAHLPIMCDFWETVLFRAGLYQRNALQLHYALHAMAPLGEAHFARWLELWTATVDERHVGEKAVLAKLQAARIAGSMHRRLNGESGSRYVTIGRREE